MRRHLMGIMSIVLLIGGAVSYFFFPMNESLQGTAGACIKVGSVLGALWLALPQINRMPWWLYASILGGVVIIARWPHLWWLVVLGVALVWLLKPRGASRTRSSSPSNENSAKSN